MFNADCIKSDINFQLMMKCSRLTIVILLFLFTFLYVACSKDKESPIDEYIEIIEQETDKLEKVNNSEAFQKEIEEFMRNSRLQDLEKEYADYTLSYNDKDRLKTSVERFMRVALSKTMDYVGNSQYMNQLKESQLDAMIEAVKTKIDNAKTFGEIGHP